MAPIPLLSQVTIGSGTTPAKAALLQIKEFEEVVPGGENAQKGGLLLPRVSLPKPFELLPFFDVSELGTPDYINVQKPSHTGLTAYNIGSVKLPAGLYT